MTTRAEADDRLAAWAGAAWRASDREVLGLCAALMARTLGAEARDLPEIPEAWWSSASGLSARDRACLRFTEQWLLDVSGIDDGHVDALLDHFTAPEVLGLLMSLVAIEQQLRVTLCLERVLGAVPA